MVGRVSTGQPQLPYIEKIVTGDAQTEDPDRTEFAALFTAAQELLEQ